MRGGEERKGLKSWSWRVDSSLYYIIPQVYIKSVDCDQRLLADVSAAVQAMNFFPHFFPMVMLCPVAGLVTTWWPYSPGPNAPHSIFCCYTTHLSVQPANMDVYPTVERRAHFFSLSLLLPLIIKQTRWWGSEGREDRTHTSFQPSWPSRHCWLFFFFDWESRTLSAVVNVQQRRR